MESFNRQNLPLVSKAIQAGLDAAAKELGISLKVGNCSFNEKTFSIKVEGGIIDSSTGKAITREYTNLVEVGKLFLGEDFDHEKTYTFNGKEIRFIGIASRSSKFPYICEELAGGRKFKISETAAERLVGKKVPA